MAYAKNFVDGQWYNYNGMCDTMADPPLTEEEFLD
jgi:hypothetical protein